MCRTKLTKKKKKKEDWLTLSIITLDAFLIVFVRTTCLLENNLNTKEHKILTIVTVYKPRLLYEEAKFDLALATNTLQ